MYAMDSVELNLNIEGGDAVAGSAEGGGSTSKKLGGDGFIDRSKVRILLCDNNANSSVEVHTLLMRCSYQVTSVRSARQVIDALNAEGPDIDLILSEVDIPMSKGMKMLKYITRHKDLRRIPVIMMSSQDEVSTVVKCLRLGAANYLVKPLRTNELLNLWTHMWRRRRMLGLVEKNVLCYDFDVVASDPSDANTTSTTLFSDDTDERSRRTAAANNPEIELSVQQEDESAFQSAAADAFKQAPNCLPDVPGISDCRTGQLCAGPKKSELRIGESSAFFTYVKSSHKENSAFQNQRIIQNTQATPAEETSAAYDTALVPENGEACEKWSQGDDFQRCSSLPNSMSLERSCTPPGPTDYLQQKNNFVGEKVQQSHLPHISGLPPQNTFPYYMPGVMMAPPSQMYQQQNLHDFQNHASASASASAMLPLQYNHFQHCAPHIAAGMASFPYYMCLPPNQISAASTQPWSNSSSREMKTNHLDKREAALLKFRQKRKERCFDKKIRYVNRKKLAERRPRVRGQFVRKVNGVNVDLNGHPASAEYDDDEAEAEEGYSMDDDNPAHIESPC